jgi:hypothetical protein
MKTLGYMNSHLKRKTKTKQKQKVIKKETKPKQKPNMSWWEEHCKWLDTFRGKIVSKDDRY